MNKLQKRQSVCVKLKKMRSDDCAKIWNFLDSRKALSQRRGTKPSKLLKKICVLFDMWKYNYAVENVQRVDCWYVKLIWFRKLRFVMLELDSEMEDIQLVCVSCRKERKLFWKKCAVAVALYYAVQGICLYIKLFIKQ